MLHRIWEGRGRDEKYIQSFGRKPEATRPLRRIRRRWEDNVTMDLREVRWEVVDWIDLAQDTDHWRHL